ncbi:Crp/Fnr family transcriptional regulator [Treponema sp.]
MSDCPHCKAEQPSNCIQIVPIFSGLTYDEMMEIANITTEKKYQKGETVYLAGKTEKRLYVIHSGRVKISRLSPTGKSQLIRVLGPGEFMGELTILNDAPLSDYAEAIEACTMCMIEGLALKDLMQKYPSIALKVMEELSSRLEKAETLIEDINLHSAERRLAGELISLSDGRTEFDLALSKGDLASKIGMTQETLSRKLTIFQDQGLISLRGQRTILILNRKALADIE